MGFFKLYLKSMRYVIPRALFAFLSIAFAYLVISVIALVDTENGSVALRVVVTVLAAVAGIAYTLINGHGKRKYFAAEIYMLTHGIANPQGEEVQYKRSFGQIRETFSAVSVLELVIATVKEAFGTFVTKTDHDHEDYAETARDMLLLFLAFHVPVFGYCCLSWTYLHDDDPMVKNVCDTAEVITKGSGRRTLLVAAGVLVAEIVLWAVLAGLLIVAYIAFYNKFNDVLDYDALEKLLADGNGPEYAEQMLLYLLSSAAMYILWFFAQPAGIIVTLRVFLREGLANPPAGKTFEKVMATFKKVSTDFTAKYKDLLRSAKSEPAKEA